MPTPGGPYSGIWKLKDISKYVQDNNWPEVYIVGSGRALLMGGSYPSVNTVDFISIPTTGNAADFGDLATATRGQGGGSSSTRAVNMGSTYSITDTITYIEMASEGNGSDFGDLLSAQGNGGQVSNSTRAIIAGGQDNSGPGFTNVIQYVTIASTGNALDFGDILFANARYMTGASSPTRGVYMGSYEPGKNNIDYITIASEGNGTDFGDLSVARGVTAGFSSDTRAVIANGNQSAPVSAQTNVIDYITIATTGNAIDFGDALEVAQTGVNGTSNNTRGVWGGTQVGPAPATNTIQYVTIASTGNATDFGDLTLARLAGMWGSDSHGGLQ